MRSADSLPLAVVLDRDGLCLLTTTAWTLGERRLFLRRTAPPAGG